MASISDVAKKAGVSKSTVSRVLNPGSSVSPATREKVEKVIASLNFQPDSIAQALKKKRSGIIGAVMIDISSPYYASLLGGIQSKLMNKSQELLMASSFGNREKEKNAIQSLLRHRCEGLLVYLENCPDEKMLAQLNLKNTRIVTLGQSCPDFAANSVLVDNEYGGYLAAKHLLDMGHRQILVLAGLTRYQDAVRRKQGFVRAMEEYGIKESQYEIRHGEFNEEFGYSETKKVLQGKPGYTAICAGDDDIAAGVILALRESGIKVPEEMSVIGYDDNFHAQHTFPALTTIKQPIFNLGETATELMLNVLENPDEPGKQIMLKPELVVRDSVACITKSKG